VNTRLPGLAGTDHVGFTVPDLEAATRFFVEVIGCVQVFEIGPFQSDDDWMQLHLGVDPRAVIRKLRMFRCKTGGASFEIFEYELDGAMATPPRNSDVGGHHLAFYVEDVSAAVGYLKARGITVQGEPTTMQSGPSKGLTWVYFLSPWGMQLELVSYQAGMDVLRANFGVLWSPKDGSKRASENGRPASAIGGRCLRRR
jgi:catechol 2,3-dioxygenase-like lactoylglutathione lyase family enzyme